MSEHDAEPTIDELEVPPPPPDANDEAGDDEVIEGSAEATPDAPAETSTVTLDTPSAAPASAVFAIEVDHRERVTYAMAYNKLSTIRAVRIRNLGATPGEPLTLTVRSRWSVTERPPLQEYSVTLDAPALEGVAEMDMSACRLDDTAMVNVAETAPAIIEVEVVEPSGRMTRTERDITILARNQWTWDSLPITAAFVQPNHPAVAGVLNDASELLRTRTGSSALEGYQRDQEGPGRADAIARAIFDALTTRIPNYIDPPAGYEDEGQKLRPLDQVLDERQGTCFDLACAYASCLEQAGLHPVIFIVHGHAFTGYFRRDRTDAERKSTGPLITEPALIQNLVDSGLLNAVDAVNMPNGGGFDAGVDQVQHHFSRRSVNCGACRSFVSRGIDPSISSHLRAAIDVMVAHERGIRPLPARIVEGDVIKLVIDNGPSLPPVIERRDARTQKLLPQTVPARVQQWKNSLLDLTRRSGGLLNFTSERSGATIITPPGILGELEDRLSDGQTVDVFGLDDDRIDLDGFDIRSFATTPHVRTQLEDLWKVRELIAPHDSVDLEKRLKNLASRARSELQETGINNLNLAIGLLREVIPGQLGPMPEERPEAEASEAPDEVEPAKKPKRSSGPARISAPVFLVPVKLEFARGAKAYRLRIDEAGITTPNYSMLEYMRANHGLELSWFKEDMRDAAGLDIEEGMKRLREELVERGLAARFAVEDSVGLGMLRFGKIRLWRDLEEHWEAFADNPVVKHLVPGIIQPFHDPADPDGDGAPPFDDTTLRNPQPADGAQTRAIVRALAGHSFVLEGPPGTGKSQTITNLLANALAEGRKVLFVAEKPEALKVVRDRLTAVGLDPFCLDLHDKGSSTQRIKDQIGDALDFVPDADVDAWDRLATEFDVVSSDLEDYRQRLHGRTPPVDESFIDVYLRRRQLGDGPSVTFGRAGAQLGPVRSREIRELLDSARQTLVDARLDRHHAWRFTDVRDLSAVDRPALADAIGRVRRGIDAIATASGAWMDALRAARDLDDLRGASAAVRAAVSGSLPDASGWRDLARADASTALIGALDAMSGALDVLADLDASADPSVLARDLESMRAPVRAAATSFFLGRRGRTRTALGDLAAMPCFADPAQTPTAFDRLADACGAHRAAIDVLRMHPAVAARLPSGPLTRDALAELRSAVADLLDVARVVTDEGPAATALLAATGGIALPSDDTRAAAVDLVDGLDAVLALVSADPAGVAAWTQDRGILAAIEASLPTWRDDADGLAFVRLSRIIDVLVRLAQLEEEVLADLRMQLLDGTIPAEDAATAFQRGYLDAALRVIGEEQRFDVFDWMSHERTVERFIDLLDRRQELLQRIIPHGLHAARSFDASATIGMVGRLRTELNAKRRGAKSVRDLINRYPDLILQLTPCFLMSPDSVAKFLEPGKVTFDMVVFDEASQIPVADAIGAMGRARSVIVVGDSRQMPPSIGFGRGGNAAPEEDEFEVGIRGMDDPIVEDAESILEECVEFGLPSEMLSWHYRSRDEVLIAFSNRHYYEGRLSSFPAPVGRRPDLGIEYRRVQGQFYHGSASSAEPGRKQLVQTNPIEADAIVAEVQRRVHDPHLQQYSLGIVTLNAKQQQLVRRKLELLEDPVVTELLTTEDSDRALLVRNLESVQGAERDVILLGTSFSRREGGGPMPLNFGPLNNARGERRLNVAVTRARRQVIIFTSFEPEDLHSASAIGLQHLRDYLLQARDATYARETVDEDPAKVDLQVREVADALRERGLIVTEAYGLSSFKVDLAVTTPEHPDRWLVGVLLDGRGWGARQLVLDRDALPVTVLRGLMQWPRVARVWLPAWLNSRTEVLDEIEDQVRVVAKDPDSASGIVPTTAPSGANGTAAPHGAVPSATATKVTATTRSAAEPAEEDDGAQPPTSPSPIARAPIAGAAGQPGASGRARPYVSWEFRAQPGSPEQMEHATSVVRARIEAIASAEGPVLLDEALRTVARTFGLNRVRESRLATIRPTAPKDLLIETPFGVHLFAPGQLDGDGTVSPSFDWYRTTTFAERRIEAISPHEVLNAATELARIAHGIGLDELAAELLVTFGYQRRTADSLQHARRVATWGISEGRLIASGEVVHPPAG